MSRIRVTFKDETTVDGHRAGPVKVIDLDLYEADPMVVRGFVPYGHTPQGVDDRGWLLWSEAAAIAAEHGVELEEL